MIYEPQTFLEQFFIFTDYPINLEKGRYIQPFVLLSYIIAVMGSYTALSLLNELWLTKNQTQRRLIHFLSALSLGVGIWSMHFVGMLAYDMEMVHSYNIGITVISMIIAASVAYGFILIVQHFKQSALTYILSSIALGIAICAMHYTGMAAMVMQADILYDPLRFGLSVLIAVSASAAAIRIIYYLKGYSGARKKTWQIAAALIMGAAICGMHYMGMHATVFLPYADCRFDPQQTYYGLAAAVSMISGTILIAAVSLTIFLKEKRETHTKSNPWNTVPIMIAIFGTLITIFSSFELQKHYLDQNEMRVDRLVEQTKIRLEGRYRTYLQSLRGGLGLFKASSLVTRADWKNFTDAQQIEDTLPGINGIGFIEYIEKENLEEFLEKTRADGVPDFTNHPPTDFSNKFVIKYIEPVSKNMGAVGLDIGFEANRRAAAERSMRTAKEALTNKIELVQDNKKRAGFLLLLPIYGGEGKELSEQERINKISGWIYAPFIGENFLNDLNPPDLAYAVYDGTTTTDDHLIYKSPEFNKAAFETANSRENTVEIAGRDWTILWHITPNFVFIGSQTLAYINFIIGLIVTGLLVGMTYLLSRRTQIIQKLVEEKTKDLEEVNAELEEFAYRTSHDLRSPIISSASLLELSATMIDNGNTESAKEGLMHAKKSLDRLRQLIDDILQLTVIRNKDEDNTEFAVEDVVNEAIEKLSNMENYERLRIETDYGYTKKIKTKKLRFTMIAENLISNAIKYQDLEEDAPFIQIKTSKSDDGFVFEVTDNGIGIPEDQRDKLFQMFKRFHPKVAYGSGLGLYLLKKSADALGADIAHEDPGKGSTFKLKINADRI